MSITVKIPQQPEKLGIKEDIKLKVRKTMGNQLVVEDHPDVDIVIYPDSNKICSRKASHKRRSYDTRSLVFAFRNEGIIKPESVHSGFVYGSMEGEMFVNENHDMIQVALFGINKFIVEEKPYFEHIEEFEKAVDDYLTQPTPADSTPLGEVPQEPVKGSIRPGWIRGPYGMNIMYRI